MKRKILLMAILSASVLSGCFHVPEYKAGENVVFKNSTEREIDYIYDTNSTFSDQYQFKAQGKEIDYAAATLLPGEEKKLYGISVYAHDLKQGRWGFDFMLRIPYQGEQKWLCVCMTAGYGLYEENYVLEITEELIQKIENQKRTMTDLPDEPSLFFEGKEEMTDKTKPSVVCDMGNIAFLPYWDSWNSENEFPLQQAKIICKDTMDDIQSAGITEFSYIYQDIVYSMSLQDGKRTRIGAVTEAEKNQGLK